MTLKPLFSDSFLATYLLDFRLSSVTGIREIQIKIEGLILELNSGKFDTLKEEEIKSRFVDVFFGDVLGFNYGNSNKWLLREEKKTLIDGTKVDAALGYFYKDNEQDDVRAIIEIKDSNTDLDISQNRPGKLTSIEQAFRYAAKMGGNCKWVIVSNIKEFRFYASTDMSKAQVFLLRDLVNESKLKELIFLFKKID